MLAKLIAVAAIAAAAYAADDDILDGLKAMAQWAARASSVEIA